MESFEVETTLRPATFSVTVFDTYSSGLEGSDGAPRNSLFTAATMKLYSFPGTNMPSAMKL